MVPSAHTATLPESDMTRHDEYAMSQSYLPSARYVEHHPREGLYRQFSSPHLHGKYDPPEGYPFVFPSPHPTESHFGSPAEHKPLHRTPNSYLSASFESAYVPCESPHSHTASIQDSRVCNAENSPDYTTFRMSHATLNHENTARPEFNSHSLPHPNSAHTLPLLVHPSDTYVPYATEPQPSDYYHPIQPISYQYYAPSSRGMTPSEFHSVPMNGDMNHYAPPVQPQNNNRPFKCGSCSSGFNRNHDLKRHTRIHLLVKPFPCGWCEKTFSRKDALKRHLMVKGCAGNEKVTVDESIRRAEENKLTKNRNTDASSFTLPFSAHSSPHVTPASEESSHSPNEEATFLSSSSGSEESQLMVGNMESNASDYARPARSKQSRASHDGGNPSERFAPYARPASYHHRSQPNILAYGRESWRSSDMKSTGYNSSSEATAVLPPPRASELSSTSSISSLLDGPDYGAELRAAFNYSHSSTPAGYAQTTSFPGEEYSRSMYHSTPRSSTSDSVCSSTLTTSNPTVKSETPAAQQNSSPSPPLTPSITATTDTKPVTTGDATFEASTSPPEHPIEIKHERSSRSPTPQELPCISSIRCRAN